MRPGVGYPTQFMLDARLVRGMRLFAATLLIIALSGCTDDEAVNAAQADDSAGGAAVWAFSELDRDVITASNLAVYGALEEVDAFIVKSNATTLVVNVSVQMTTPNGLTLRFAPAGCDTLQGDCAYRVTTDGEAQLVIDAPEAGEWHVVAFADVGAAAGSYHVLVGQLLEDVPAADDGHGHPCEALC